MSKEEYTGLQMEYSTIRDEILHTIDSKDQYVIAMYTLSFTILGLYYTFYNLNLLFLELLILLIFQSYLSTKTMKIAKCGAYIKVNIESKLYGMKWEHLNKMVDSKFRNRYMLSIGSHEVLRLIRRHGSLILSIICLVTYMINVISISGNRIILNLNNGIKLVVFGILTLFVLILNIQSTHFYKMYKQYEDILLELDSNENA